MAELLDVSHHYTRGCDWLLHAERSQAPHELNYAGLEFRLAIERLLSEYLYRVRGDRLDLSDFDRLHSAKRVERLIYELAGHQRIINGKIAFMQVLFDALQIRQKIATPEVGKLAGWWQSCSDYCHIVFTIAAASLPSAITDALSALGEVRAGLKPYYEQIRTWPRIADPAFRELESSFIEGRADRSEILAHLKRSGVYAILEAKDGSKSFIGTAMAPDGGKPESGAV